MYSAARLVAGLLAGATAISGCAITEFRDSQTGVEVARYSLGANLGVMNVSARVTPDGEREIAIQGVRSEQTEAIRAAVEGAVRGLK